jgi:phosphohistidine phosphatase
MNLAAANGEDQSIRLRDTQNRTRGDDFRRGMRCFFPFTQPPGRLNCINWRNKKLITSRGCTFRHAKRGWRQVPRKGPSPKSVRNFPRALPCTMPRLILIRHAEAVAHAPQGDLKRPLTARGYADAVRMGAYAHTSGLVPELALVSPARRACDTLDGMLQEFPQKPACEIEDLLYAADVDVLRGLVEGTSASINTLLIVGHNPGLAEFARYLVDGQNADAPLRHFPAPCLAEIHFSCADWIDACACGGELDRFMNFSCVPADDLLSH